MSQIKYPHLFEPLKVNQMIIKNRIISAPLGSLTDKSKTGMGMIIRGTSGNVPGKRSRMAPGPYCFENMEESQKVRRQVSIIRQRGSKAEFELCHVGQYALVEEGDYAVGPVSFIRDDGTEVRGMDEEMMDIVADQFAQGAMDAKEYGFDMVMLHYGHGWLPTQFLSPYFNKRTDEYGGSFENRIKYPLMILERVRKAVGPNYPLDMRISLDEYLEGGTTTEEVIEFLKHAEKYLDMVHVSCGVERELDAMTRMSTSTYFPHKINVKLSKRVKEALNIPVAVVGAIMTPEQGESIIANGEADAIVVGRQIIADPFWTVKAREGRSEDIVPCLRCLNCYNQYSRDRSNHYGMKSITNCAVNPRYLNEDRVPVCLSKANKRKKIFIIGGGPAGLKAALTAHERGHKVIVMEKESVLGGQLICADYDDSKMDLKRYKDYLIHQVSKTDIEVRLNTDALDHLDEMRFANQIVVAVGAEPMILKIKGYDRDNVTDALSAYQNQDAIGKNVAIIGGGSVGTELAKLLGLDRNVHLIELTGKLCANLNEHMREGLLQIVNGNKNIHQHLNSQCSEITDEGVIIETKQGQETIKVDTVIFAVGMKSRSELANKFFNLIEDTNIIGDANRVGTVAEATQDGYFVCQTV